MLKELKDFCVWYGGIFFGMPRVRNRVFPPLAFVAMKVAEMKKINPRRVEGSILAHIQSGGSLFEKLKNLEDIGEMSAGMAHNPNVTNFHPPTNYLQLISER